MVEEEKQLRNFAAGLGFLVVFVMIFYPSARQTINDLDVQKTKQTLNLASKVLVNAIDLEGANYEVFSLGYYLENEDMIKIDKDRLVSEFNNLLYSRYLDADKLAQVQASIPALVLTYGDKFYVAERKTSLKPGGNVNNPSDYNISFEWLPPMFYTLTDDSGRLIYVNLRDETSMYYEKKDTKITAVKLHNKDVFVGGKRLDKEIRDKTVISNINRVVQEVTYDPANDSNGFQIQIRTAGFENKDTSGMNIKEKQDYYNELREISNFNVLEGITFFIIYAADSEGVSNNELFRYRNYNASGFTLVKRY
jgi:hypothetical protein